MGLDRDNLKGGLICDGMSREVSKVTSTVWRSAFGITLVGSVSLSSASICFASFCLYPSPCKIAWRQRRDKAAEAFWQNHYAENIAVELRFVVSALRRATILSRNRPIAADLARLREAAEG